ncbi:MAG: hypothetical protein U5K00_20300 [Melioribacteraceae bacterium]|nr:hypothetical protein [Melioribacteraceae bacterium]
MQVNDQNAALRKLSALVDFSNLINSSLEIEFTINNLLLTCFGKFRTTRGCVAIMNDQEFLEIKSAKGIPKEATDSFPR